MGCPIPASRCGTWDKRCVTSSILEVSLSLVLSGSHLFGRIVATLHCSHRRRALPVTWPRFWRAPIVEQVLSHTVSLHSLQLLYLIGKRPSFDARGICANSVGRR